MMFDAVTIKREVPILSVLPAYGVHLDRNHAARCPFHKDKDPSFRVYPATNSFYCFGCNASGTVIDFVMRMEAITFPEAVDRIGERFSTGAPIPRQREHRPPPRPATPPAPTARTLDIYRAFLDSLTLTDAGRRYLTEERGLSSETLDLFRVGSMDEPARLFEAMRKRFTVDELKAAGLATDRGPVFYLPAVVFPYFDEQGRPVYFSTRNLTGPVKSFKLAGVSQRLFIGEHRAVGDCLLFEGIVDGLSYFELTGQRNFIALSGTITPARFDELTAAHPDRTLILAFDNDAAGEGARERIEAAATTAGRTPPPFLDWGRLFALLGITGSDGKDMNEVLRKRPPRRPSDERKNPSPVPAPADMSEAEREAFDERVAIREYDGNMTRAEAEKITLLSIRRKRP